MSMMETTGPLDHRARGISDGEIARRTAPFNQLTMLEANTLLYVFSHHTAKEIALIEGVSPDAIVARINRARRKLGNVSRAKAARMIVEEFGSGTYHAVVSQPLVIPSSPESDNPVWAPAGATGQMRAERFRWPVPTKERPVNDDSPLARIIWPVLLALLSIIAMILLQSLMIGLNGQL